MATYWYCEFSTDSQMNLYFVLVVSFASKLETWVTYLAQPGKQASYSVCHWLLLVEAKTTSTIKHFLFYCLLSFSTLFICSIFYLRRSDHVMIKYYQLCIQIYLSNTYSYQTKIKSKYCYEAMGAMYYVLAGSHSFFYMIHYPLMIVAF